MGRWCRRRSVPSDDLIPSLLATSDVLGTGWFAADAANVKPGSTVVVVGDGAVGLLGVLSAKQMGAERIIAMSRHETRQKLAREFGATDIVTERGDEGVARIKELTNGVGADSVLECVGTQESMTQAIHCTRPGGYVGYVGVPHGVELDGEKLFFAHVHLHGGPAPVRRYLPHLIDLVLERKINPGKVFDLTLPLDQVAEGYRAMDERRAIKTLLRRLIRKGREPCHMSSSNSGPASPSSKSRLAEGITQAVMAIFDYGEESVSVAMEEITPEDWAEQVYPRDILGHPETLCGRKNLDTPCRLRTT